MIELNNSSKLISELQSIKAISDKIENSKSTGSSKSVIDNLLKLVVTTISILIVILLMAIMRRVSERIRSNQF